MSRVRQKEGEKKTKMLYEETIDRVCVAVVPLEQKFIQTLHNRSASHKMFCFFFEKLITRVEKKRDKKFGRTRHRTSTVI